MISFESAREQLAFHSGSDPRIDDPRWQNGLLSTLRPYRGLRRDVLRDVRECLDAISGHLRNSPTLDRQVINSLWAISHFCRAWALESDGMLRRNNLISDEDRADLESWLHDFSYRIATLLDGSDPESDESPSTD